ncbi:MAG TPA: hypothetical protein DEA50_16130 [Parvularcula sp.]|nr:hypothetical protein [Parvularcula sp.]
MKARGDRQSFCLPLRMARESQSLMVLTKPPGRAVLRPALRLRLRQNGETLSRFEAAETYRRADAALRHRKALCVDKLA